ncbi:hypothetical protein FOZ60_012880 [Perkinsus olseni]|uniref:Uncharacterized protein n=1 Tax=Perkinsus olseni TaxID=32597 RepID=A0A7J6NAC7_PEROL|nr:hypothetical protein FOZ60_012880 [Perkinsus olseni]
MLGSTIPSQNGGEPGHPQAPSRECRTLYDSLPALLPGRVPLLLQASLRFTSTDGQEFDAALTNILAGLLSHHVVARRMSYLLEHSTSLTRLISNGIVAATPVDSASPEPLNDDMYTATYHMLISWTKYCAQRDGHASDYAAPVALLISQRLVMVLYRIPELPRGFLSSTTVQTELHHNLDCIQWARPPAPTPSSTTLPSRDHPQPTTTSLTVRPPITPSTSESARRAQQWAYQATAPHAGTFNGGPSESYVSFKNDMLRMKMVHNFDTLAFYYYTLRYLGGVALREAHKVLAVPTDSSSLPVDRIWERLDALYMNSTAIRNVITTYSEQRQTTSEPIDDFLTRFEYTLIDYEATVGVDLTDDQKIGQLLSAVQPVLRDELTMRRDTTGMTYATFRSSKETYWITYLVSP